MPAQLVSLTEGPSILLDKPVLLLGRHPECDIQIDSRKVSRRHCCIAQVHDYLVVRDLASTNGIRINGVRVLEGRLKPGDEVTIGSHRYRVQWDSVVSVSVSPAHKALPKAEPARVAVPVHAAADDLLEASDEPVALAEPDGAPAVVANGPFAAPASAKRPQAPDDSVPLPFEEQVSSHIIPDQLKLAPASDQKLRTPPPSA
jgi:predicted component of type VI protein secretion system